MFENFQCSFFPLIQILLFCSDSVILYDSEITTYYSSLKNDSKCNLKFWLFTANWETMSEKTTVWIRTEYENQTKSFQSQFWCSVTLSFVTLAEAKLSFQTQSLYELSLACLLRDNYFISLLCQRWKVSNQSWNWLFLLMK